MPTAACSKVTWKRFSLCCNWFWVFISSLPAQDLSGPGAMKGGTEHADEQTVGDEQAPLQQILASLDTHLVNRWGA